MIEVGDTVDVFFDSVPWEYDLIVEGKPCATGDCWKLVRQDGTPINVIAFAKMVKVEQCLTKTRTSG